MAEADDHNRVDDDDEDEEDEDYVPGAEEDVDEEFEEDQISDDPDAPVSGKSGRKAKRSVRQSKRGEGTFSRKRARGGIMLSDESEDEKANTAARPKVEAHSETQEQDKSVGDITEASTNEGAAKSTSELNMPKPKSKVDDFWEEMKRGAASTAKPAASSASTLAQILGQRGTSSAASGNLTSLISSLGTKPSSQTTPSTSIISMFPQTVTKKETYTVKEVAEFAGERVTVEKQIEVGSAEDMKQKAGPKKTNLDGLLERLSGKGKSLSVKAKTEHDWSKFKAKEGLEDELATYRKNGYIDKMGFLARSEARKEELLREERDAERRARARQSGAAD